MSNHLKKINFFTIFDNYYQSWDIGFWMGGAQKNLKNGWFLIGF